MLWVLIRSASGGASNEYPQHMFSWTNKKDISIFRMKKAPYLLLCLILNKTGHISESEINSSVLIVSVISLT